MPQGCSARTRRPASRSSRNLQFRVFRHLLRQLGQRGHLADPAHAADAGVCLQVGDRLTDAGLGHGQARHGLGLQVRPDGTGPVHEVLQQAGEQVEVDRRAQDEAVRFHQGGVDLLHVVLNVAGPLPFRAARLAAQAPVAALDLLLAEQDELGLDAPAGHLFQQPPQHPFGVAFAGRAADANHFHSSHLHASEAGPRLSNDGNRGNSSHMIARVRRRGNLQTPRQRIRRFPWGKRRTWISVCAAPAATCPFPRSRGPSLSGAGAFD